MREVGKAAPLREYGRKRRFEATPEPAPSKKSRRTLEVVVRGDRVGARFCVQEHHASRLHYDLRLEIDGVLKSWAVPKGPSLDPEVRRLAVATEDHPLDYLTFEGKIPEGNYGAGEVIVWDLGEWEPLGEKPPLKQWENGHLKFRLRGKKLGGEFALAHIEGRAAKAGEPKPENHWLLIKKPDDAVRYGDSAEMHPGSVLSGPVELQLVATSEAASDAPNPRPMLATLGQTPVADAGWIFEIKWDGIRAMARCRNGAVQLVSRTGRDITAVYPELSAAPFLDDVVLDGEIVALDADGRSSFARLQRRINLGNAAAIAEAAREVPVHFYAFDVLSLHHLSRVGEPLLARKGSLRALGLRDPWRYSDHVVGEGPALFEQAKRRGLEGIVGKRADSRYAPGRSADWVKYKTQLRQEAVIIGYTDPQGSRSDFGALLLAVFDVKQGKFVYVGKVGTGFDAAMRSQIRNRLRPPARNDPKEVVGAPAGFHAVRPEMVADVRFAEWTAGGLMRAPVFVGLRPDKSPRECVREVPGG